MHLFTQAKNSVSALELKRHPGVRYKCAWLMKHTLLQVMAEREENRELDGRVEIDDAYLGGALPGGKPGRGSQNKVSFIAAVQTTETGHPVLVFLKKLAFTKDALTEWTRKSLCSSLGPGDLRWTGLLYGRHQGRRQPQAHRHWRRRCQRQTSAIPRCQHAAEQPQNVLQWHLSCV